MLLELMKKESKYKDKDGNEKTGTSFYLQAGDQIIGIEAVNYSKEGKPDKGYVARKAILSAMASQLPPKDDVAAKA